MVNWKETIAEQLFSNTSNDKNVLDGKKGEIENGFSTVIVYQKLNHSSTLTFIELTTKIQPPTQRLS